MGDLISKILKKYGIKAIIIATIIVFIIWVLAHWTAEPGKEVSIFGGLVKYTKKFPLSENKEPLLDSHTQQITTISKDVENKPQPSPTKLPQINLPKNEENKPQPSPTKLPQIDLFVRNGISNQNRIEILDSLRSERKLRELTAIESGKKVQDLSARTYFFLLAGWLNTYLFEQDLLSWVFKLQAARYPPFKNVFEIHNISQGELHLIGYMNEIHAAEISKLSGETSREIMVSPYPWGQMTSLVSIPINRIQKSQDRHVQISKEEEVIVLDITIK